jgi:hypothetical protein
MFSRADLGFAPRGVSAWALGLCMLSLGALASGCFRAHRCGDETCDYGDDDCDGRVDEGFLDEGLYVSAEHCGGCG